MYEKILVPLDGSRLAETALPHAESLARAYGATLILMTVVTPPAVTGHESSSMEMFQENMAALYTDAERYLAGVKGELREKKIRAETHIGMGPVVGEIIEVAEARSVDLLIIASHGRTGLQRVFFGSVAAGVLSRIEKPLLVIRSSGGESRLSVGR